MYTPSLHSKVIAVRTQQMCSKSKSLDQAPLNKTLASHRLVSECDSNDDGVLDTLQ